METVWSEISLNLAQIIDNAQYKVWIAPLTAVIKDGELNLNARNEFVAKFIRSHYQDVILKAAKAVLGKEPKLNIKAAPAGAADGVSGKGHIPALEGPQAAVKPSLAQPQPLAELGSASHSRAEADNPSPKHPIPSISRNQAVKELGPQQGELPLGWMSGEMMQQHRLVKSWRYNFDDFVVGPCNELAHAAARSVCENHTNFGSVLFLCSSAGLGKTHLLQAVGANLVRSSNFSAPRIEYLTAEEFASHLRMALKSGEVDRFKSRFREADVLLLEDVHFLQEKEKTQNEVLATLSALLDRGSKVVFSSSFAPRDLRKMDGQLLSRLGSGMIACLDRPDRETRRRIISNKASAQRVNLSPDVTDYLADTMNVDIRQIESCIQNLALKARLFNRAITLDMARDTVSNYLDSVALVNLPEIVRMVCEGFGVSQDALNSKSRKQEYVQARNTAFFLARKHTSLSLQEIGRHFNRTHSTVIKGITSLEREISRESHSGRQLASTISLIEKRGKLPAHH